LRFLILFFFSFYLASGNDSKNCSVLLKNFNDLSYLKKSKTIHIESSFGYGPMVRYIPEVSNESRKIDEIKELKVGSYNTLNLVEHRGKWKMVGGEDLQQVKKGSKKPIHFLKEMGNILNELDLDIISLQEVESLEVLRYFNDEFLGSKYEPFLIKGQDQRGIQVAFLVKKDLPFKIEYHSFREYQGVYKGNKKAIFSRDLPLLVLKSQKDEEKVYSVFAGTHFKSMRDSKGDDLSTGKRTAQAIASAEIKDLIKERYGKNIPFFIMGDFNNDVRKAREFSPLREDFSDVFDMTDDLIGAGNGFGRTTHTYHPRGGKTSRKQIDGIIVDKDSNVEVLEAGIYRYKDESGKVKPVPDTYDDRKKNPSDHFPIWAVFKFLNFI